MLRFRQLPNSEVALCLLWALCEGAAATSDHRCPRRDPYAVGDPSPLGWPLVPSDWTWARPDCWQENHVVCGGQRQSPLDLRLNSVQCPLQHNGGNGVLAARSNYVEVEGARVQVSRYMGSIAVEGKFGHFDVDVGNDSVRYQATQLHVVSPSLHHIDGKEFDAELFIIHKPGHDSNALQSAVFVSMLFDASNDSDSAVVSSLGVDSDRLVPTWDTVSAVKLPSELQRALAGPSYLYNGSLPVPPCDEVVKWFILGNTMPMGRAQLQHLRSNLRSHAQLVQHRTPQRHDAITQNGVCRVIAENSVQVGGGHVGATCERLRKNGVALRAARCWDTVDRCWGKRLSAVAVDTAHALAGDKAFDLANVHTTEAIFHYKTVAARASSSTYSLDVVVPGGDFRTVSDAQFNFGHLLLNGHIFFADKISVKAIADHIIDGVRYDGEIVIEHYMFGDKLGQGRPEYSENDHTVVLSIPLKLGRSNPFLHKLELVTPRKQRIRDAVAYDLAATINLMEDLRPTLEGDWFWYSSNASYPGCGSLVRWMVFKQPMEASLEQLNCLTLPVSGTDSTQLARKLPKDSLWRNYLPNKAVELNETDCGSLPQTMWHYGQERPHWSYGNERCWGTRYPVCYEGQRQSPIDLPASLPGAQVGTDSFISRTSWKPVREPEVKNTGHNVQVNGNQFGYITLIGENGLPDYYQVVQFHVHMPSEHTIGGVQYAAELHIVHKRQATVVDLEDDDLLVTGILFSIGNENNSLLEQLFLPGAQKMLQMHHELILVNNTEVDSEVPTWALVEHSVDLMRALGPAIDGPFYRYEGSLTTPPCSEIVKWFVFETPLTMSPDQWLAFKGLYPNPANNRPLQVMNDRHIEKNSFMEGTPVHYDFYLNREFGRNYRDPAAELIVVPIIGTLVLLAGVMAATTVRRSGLGTRAGQRADLES